MASDDGPDTRHAELLDRAYRRGYALRRRRRLAGALAGLTAIAIVAVGVAAVSGGSDTHKISVVQSSTSTKPATAEQSCSTAVDAVPTADVASDVAVWADGEPVIGGGDLWTIASAVHVSGTRLQQSYLVKFPWYTKPNGLPLINARRLDGPGTFHPSVHQAFGPHGAFVTSSLVFSTPGCWEVTAHYNSSKLQFRLRVGPLPSTVVFTNPNDGYGLDFTCKVPPNANPVCDFEILETDDSGRTWIRVGGNRGVEYEWRGYPDIELAASGSNVWVYGTRTFESHDGGRTFAEVHFAGMVSALVPRGDDVWVASRACALCPTETLLSAPIGGGPWAKIAGFPNLRDPYAALVRPTASVAYVVGLDTHQVVYRTGDSGRSWHSIALPPSPPVSSKNVTVTLAALGADQVWMLNGGSAPARDQQKALYRSDDGGQQWTIVADTGPQREGVGRLPSQGLNLGLTVVTAERVWIALSQGPFTGTVDGGRHWLDTGITHIEQIQFVDPLHGWAWNGGGYRTINGNDWILTA